MYKFCLGVNLTVLLAQIGMMFGFEPQCSLFTMTMASLGVLFCGIQVWEQRALGERWRALDECCRFKIVRGEI